MEPYYHKTPRRMLTKLQRRLIFSENKVSQNCVHFIFLYFALLSLAAALSCLLSEAFLLENYWNNYAVKLFLAFGNLIKVASSDESVVFQLVRSLCIGLTFLLFTWGMVYIDSACPGVEPPTPLSPLKTRSLSGHTFHSGYVLAVFNGLLCSILHFLWS